MNGTRVITEEKMKEAITGFLVNFPFFASLDTPELGIVSDHLQFLAVEPDHILFREGDDGDCVYFVVDGELEVIKESVSGEKMGVDGVVIANLIKGRSIGEMSVIDNTPRSATVRAVSESTMVVITMSGFDRILQEHPRIGIKILKGIVRLLSMNLRKTSSMFANHMLSAG